MSGKLPLTFALVRLVTPNEGRITFDGVDITKLSERKFRTTRSDIQAIFPHEFGQLSNQLTLSKAFTDLLQAHHRKIEQKEIARRIEEAMERAGLPLFYRDEMPADLDSGERQRVALARALLLRPKLLICLDMTAGLDITVQADILNRLKDLQEIHGLTLLLLTHSLAVADHMSDYIHILNRGRILESAVPEEIVSSPEHDYTRKLVHTTSVFH